MWFDPLMEFAHVSVFTRKCVTSSQASPQNDSNGGCPLTFRPTTDFILPTSLTINFRIIETLSLWFQNFLHLIEQSASCSYMICIYPPTSPNVVELSKPIASNSHNSMLKCTDLTHSHELTILHL